MEQQNGNINYQLFCGVRIDPTHPLTNYKLIDEVFSKLDTMYTDATCYENEMCYPTAPKQTEIRYIFFGIHTANVVQLVRHDVDEIAKVA